MVLSCTAIAWQCSPRVEIAEGSAGEGGEESSSGASFGGSASGAKPGFGGGPTGAGAGGGIASGGAPSASGGSRAAGEAGEASSGGAGKPAVCTPGVNQTCNDNLAASSLWGECSSDGTCVCKPGFVVNPVTGKCMIEELPSVCALPRDPGDCDDVGVPHYYFNAETGSCDLFTVHCGGTPRNGNAFKTLDECEGACIRPACGVPFVDGSCEAAIPVFSYDASTGACEERTYGGCGGTPNRFASKQDCESACVWTGDSTPAVTIQGFSCVGFGEAVTQPGAEGSFELEGTVLKRTMNWGCGCPTRPVFVMMYTVPNFPGPAELRLCEDSHADSCAALCTRELSWDLAEAFDIAGTQTFVFGE